MLSLAAISLCLALLPAILFWRNWYRYLPPPVVGSVAARPSVSILIPARNEARSIRTAVLAALASRGVDLEVLVLDDHSTDETAAIVQAIALDDPRVRLESAPALPPRWCGKQHACYALASRAKHDLLLFIDADVRLQSDGVRRAVAFLETSQAALVSGVPRQETGTLLEILLIPLIHFILLGFLPMGRMRQTTDPGCGAGCGQLFLTRRDAYERVGGHRAVALSLHDGVKLPRAFRTAGYRTDLFDATDIATCRMYRTSGEVWRGLAKNATEGLASPAMILPATFLLFGGQVLPVILLGYAALYGASSATWTLLLIAIMASYSIRLASVGRFRQSPSGAMLHPVAVVLFLTLQWYALVRATLGMPATWKERTYGRVAASGAPQEL